MLEDITAAKLHNGDLRDLFVTFLGSECGDKLKLAINNANFVAASNSKGMSLPDHVITNVEEFHRLLASQEIPTPKAVQNLFTENKLGNTGMYMPGSFRASIGIFANSVALDISKSFGMNDSVSCSRLFYIIVNGFRWEAGHIYAQFLGAAPRYLGTNGLPQDMTPEMILQTLYYGWDIKNYAGGFGQQLTAQEIEQFTINLIIIHLFRNEMLAAPRIQHVRTSATTESENYSDIALRTTGSKSKYGELYEWARMVPYLQGVLLYYLALAYPFACMMMVVPGWHKMLFTWMSFWAWAKLWDLGFAVVMMAERSIWAMIGNSSDASRVFGRVVEMDNYGGVLVKCFGTGTNNALVGTNLPCRSFSSGGINFSSVPDVRIGDSLATGATGALPTPSWRSVIEIFDQALTIGTSIDLDRSNAYYIYIMAGLYFAVPMVTGQMVLGSKAGMAGFVKDIIGGAASEAGRAAASGFTANTTAIAQANSASLGQAATAKGYRASGLAKQALDLGNQQLAEGLTSGTLGQERSGIQAKAQGFELGQRTTSSNLQTGMQFGKAVMGSPIRTFGSFAVADAAANPGNVIGDAFNKMAGVNAQEKKEAQGEQNGPAGGGKGATPGGGNRSSLGAPGGTGLAFGATGALPGGRTGSNINYGALGRGFAFFSNGLSRAVEGGFDLAGGVGQNALTQKYNAIAADFNARGSELGIGSFQHQQYGQALQTHSGRVGAQAQFVGQTAGWEAKRDFANQASGALAAMGVQPGTLSPGPKPEDMTGMAMTGMLGAATRESGMYSAPGGAFWSAVNSDVAGLQSRYGYSSVMGAYNSNVQGWAPIMASSFNQMGDLSRQVLSSQNGSTTVNSPANIFGGGGGAPGAGGGGGSAPGAGGQRQTPVGEFYNPGKVQSYGPAFDPVRK